MAKKFYTVKKTIGKTEYTAQFSGLSTAIEAMDSTYIPGSTNTSFGKLSAYILEHVIVEPKGLTADDFESLEELSEVVAWGQEVMNGDFRDKPESSETK